MAVPDRYWSILRLSVSRTQLALRITTKRKNLNDIKSVTTKHTIHISNFWKTIYKDAVNVCV